MSDTLNESEERQLLDAVKRAVDLVERGMGPDDAIEKVAREEAYGPGKIRLVSYAYNNGRQLGQWNQGGGVLDKLASYGLADPQKIIDSVFGGPSPAEKAASDAVDPSYMLPPGWAGTGREKLAYARLPAPTPPKPYEADPLEARHRAYGLARREKMAAEEASRLASAAEDAVRRDVAGLVSYFKQGADGRITFEEFESAAVTYFGGPARPLADVVYKQAGFKREKRASDKPCVLRRGVSLDSEPFTLVAAAIKSAADCNRLRKEAETQAVRAKAAKEAADRPPSAAVGREPQAGHDAPLSLGGVGDRAARIFRTKSAMGLATEIGAIAAGDIIGQGVHERLNKEEPEEDPLDDAAQQDEIGGIRRRVTLDGMLADPNNPLSKLPAPEVVSAYNNIVKSRPHLADKPESLQPLLEAHLGGAAQKAAIDKMAILDLGMGMAGGAAGKMLGDMPKSKGDLVDSDWMDLEDPHHQNELRKIRAHTLLTQMLTDSEDPISGHDPDKVLSAYNELSSASPRVADNIHTLRPALRRKLEGHQEPFEAKELLDIEKGLASSKLPTPSTQALSDGPKNLLG